MEDFFEQMEFVLMALVVSLIVNLIVDVVVFLMERKVILVIMVFFVKKVFIVIVVSVNAPTRSPTSSRERLVEDFFG